MFSTAAVYSFSSNFAVVTDFVGVELQSQRSDYHVTIRMYLM